MVRISNIKIRKDITDQELFDIVFKKYKIDQKDVMEKRIIKKSIDARNKNDIFYNYSIELNYKNENRLKNYPHVKNLT